LVIVLAHIFKLRFSDGKVNKQSANHIGLVVYGILNASIPADQIPKNLYTWNGTNWVNQEDGSDLTDGQILNFKVKR
jgi:hypothetical protein